ncbi:hypothetical protein [Chloracidobacterium aggregatum]|uniref:hypothetical protein n=1 Tax=Chloracidobacterium aggregatum TaxID=2851959 RepID=UPI001B8D8ED8|nr:hypothetical protein [Chloracidobacterium aggregatum]QUV90053.1 hypothetical protein J8C04_07150 [Chloracidobacterium sp. A]
MNKEMIISVNAYEKRVAILENGVVVEFYVERADESKAVVGNIYKGKVRKVLPGMQSAFVDIGLERDAFLYVGDFFEETEEDLDTTESLPRLPVERSERSERPPEPVRREIDGRRGGRDRRPEVPAGRPAVTGAPEEAAAVALKPEEVTASPRLPEAPGEDGPSAEDAGGDVRVDTPLLSSLLESAGARFERVSDDLEEARTAQEGDSSRVEPSETLATGEAIARDDSLEIEREALAESTEPDAPRERRRGRRKEVIGEEKKKPSRRRGRKVEDEVAALMTSATPADNPSALEAQFERVRDEDYEEAAGDLLKDALIQQKIIAQTRIEELATKPEEPVPAPVEANEAPPMEPLTLGYERIADEDEPSATVAEPPTADAGPTTDDALLSAAADAVTADAAPAEAVPAETGAADVGEASLRGKSKRVKPGPMKNRPMKKKSRAIRPSFRCARRRPNSPHGVAAGAGGAVGRARPPRREMSRRSWMIEATARKKLPSRAPRRKLKCRTGPTPTVCLKTAMLRLCQRSRPWLCVRFR